MKSKYLIPLIGIFIVSLCIKLYPVIQYPIPIGYDSYYHIRIANDVKQNGIPSWDETIGGRPHIYPPLYHLMLAKLSDLSGIEILDITRFFLPVMSSLFVFPVFYLVKRYRDEKMALISSVLIGLNPILLTASYDSPQIISLFLLPFFVLFFLEKRYLGSGVLLGLMLLFNYFVAIWIGFLTGIFALYSFASKKYGFLRIFLYSSIISTLTISPWLISKFWDIENCLDVSTAIGDVLKSSYSTTVILSVPLILLTLLLFFILRRVKKRDRYIDFWEIFILISSIGFLSCFLTPALRPWDQFLFFGIGFCFVFPDVVKILERKKDERFFRSYVTGFLIFLILLLCTSIILAQNESPGITETNYMAIKWIDNNLDEDSMILANRDVSAGINSLSKNKAILDMFYECILEKKLWKDINEILETKNASRAEELIKDYKIEYVIVSKMDEGCGYKSKGGYCYYTKKFDEMEILELKQEFIKGDDFTRIYAVTN